MDFKLVLQKLLVAFDRSGVKYALIGGFAMGLWGAGRSTVDIDFLADRDDIDQIDVIMKKLGYQCRFQTENVGQYVSDLNVFGEVDFLYAFRPVSLGMLKRAGKKEIFNGALKIRVLKPEDIIGLKLQAINNDPVRQKQDLPDIEALMSLHRNKLDWKLLKKYFSMFEMANVYNKLYRSYGL
ncbi:MAG: nucleotidyl transferase AbiEii/AbiGii toxin family protein [Candidatus Brocadiia bacterium]